MKIFLFLLSSLMLCASASASSIEAKSTYEILRDSGAYILGENSGRSVISINKLNCKEDSVNQFSCAAINTTYGEAFPIRDANELIRIIRLSAPDYLVYGATSKVELDSLFCTQFNNGQEKSYICEMKTSSRFTF